MSQQAFQQLLKSLPRDEREKVLKTAMAYGLSADDPAWLILALNQSGLFSINQAISALNNQRDSEVLSFKATAKEIANGAMESAANYQLDKISEKIANTAQHIYKKQVLKVSTAWFICATIIGISFFIGTTTLTYQYLKNTFYSQAQQAAYERVVDEQARASWANSETGKLAYSLAQVTDIKALATCKKTKSGWKILGDKKNVCIPHPLNKQITGWHIPG